jgi:hypothetical protein
MSFALIAIFAPELYIVLFFDFRDEIDSSGVPAALEFRIQKNVNDFKRVSCAYDTSAKREDVGVIMPACILS